MYRKLNSHICISAILTFFILIFAENDKAGMAFSGFTAVALAESSAQSGDSLTGIQLKAKRKIKRDKPMAFFSAKGGKNILKELNQRSQDFSQKSWKALPVWLKVNKNPLLIVSAILICILFSVNYYRKQKKTDRFMTTTRLSVVNTLVQQACRYIEKKHSESDLTVDRLCTDLVTGKAYLEVLFKKELGMRVEDFINQVRINRVKILVSRNPQISLPEIVRVTGFSDENDCLTVFRDVNGVDLEDYRNKLIHNSNQF